MNDGGKRNLSLLRSKLEAAGLDAVVAVNKKSVVYLSNAPTAGGWMQMRADGPRICFVVWPARGEPVLIVGALEGEVTPEYSYIPRIETYPEYAQTPYEKLAEVLDEAGLRGKRVGIEKRVIGAAYWEQLTQAHRDTIFVEAGPLLDAVRAKKTPAEVEIFRRNCALFDRVFLSVFSAARPGMTELELHNDFIHTAAAMGASEVWGNLLSGERAMVIHRPSTDKRIARGDIIRTDYLAWWEGRCVNLSRVFVVGEPSAEQRAIYKALREIHLDVFEHIKPGVGAYDLFKHYVGQVKAHGFTPDLPLLGHNIGVDAHEEPMIAQAETGTLEEGMVVVVEPFFRKQFQIQDQLLVTATGSELLSKDFDTREMFVID